MAAAESVLGTEVNGTTYNKSQHSTSRTISALTKDTPFFLPEEHIVATYSAIVSAAATTTSAAHLFAIEADGTNFIRIHSIEVVQVAGATTQTLMEIAGFRTSTAGSGGTAITARPFDSADSAFGGLIRSIGTKGTEGTQLLHGRLQLQTTAQVAATTVNPNSWKWAARGDQKPIMVGSATTEGFVIKIITGIATSTVDITVEFSSTPYA